MRGRARLGTVLRLGLALAVVLGLFASGGSAGAAGVVECRSTASIHIQPGATPGTWDWEVVFNTGSCSGDFRGPYAMTGGGVGTSTGLGLCDGLLVQDLNLAMTINLVSAKGPAFNKTLNETWSGLVSPSGLNLTTFPIATPFVVTNASGSQVGGGVIFNRLFLTCPPGGNPGAVTFHLRLF